MMRIIFKKFGFGWVEFTVLAPPISYDILGSNCLCDCLSELLRAVICLHEGDEDVFIEFWEEPHSKFWHLRRDGQRLDIRRYFRKDSVPYDERTCLPDDVRFVDVIETDLANFTRSVHGLFACLLEKYGRQGYEVKWKPFPEMRWAQVQEICDEM